MEMTLTVLSAIINPFYSMAIVLIVQLVVMIAVQIHKYVSHVPCNITQLALVHVHLVQVDVSNVIFPLNSFVHPALQIIT